MLDTLAPPRRVVPAECCRQRGDGDRRGHFQQRVAASKLARTVGNSRISDLRHHGRHFVETGCAAELPVQLIEVEDPRQRVAGSGRPVTHRAGAGSNILHPAEGGTAPCRCAPYDRFAPHLRRSRSRRLSESGRGAVEKEPPRCKGQMTRAFD